MNFSDPALDEPIPADRPVDPWFDDAKIGIFLHWGVYSANNPYSEWYLWTLRIPNSPTALYHAQHYGDADYYDAFVPAFNEAVEKWDPSKWERLFRWAGGKYAVVT
ncbi:hypothetical protein HDU93_004195, partial [Gonapodya sp. JEL0774]